MRRTRTALARLAGAILCVSSPPALAQKGMLPTTVVVAGQPMSSDRDIMDNLGRSPDHTVFVALLKAAGLADSLTGHGPFTVFAPTNAAFALLPPGRLEQLRRPENKAQLASVLDTNIVAGNYSVARLRYLLRQGKGSAELDTTAENKIDVQLNGPQNLTVKGPKGETADIVVYDAKQANGVLFVTDRVLLPD